MKIGKRHLNRRINFGKSLPVALATACTINQPVCTPMALAHDAPAHRPPNVVVIFVDDLGIGDVGCYGAKDIPTPHIDSIATNGVLCKQGYVTAPQCAPSRAGLLTGRYQQKFGFEFNPPVKQSFELGLPRSEAMIFSRMKDYGYRTGVVGKWHLGRGEGYCPWDRDVDYFYGVLDGTSWYFPPYDWAARFLGLDDITDIHRNNHLFVEREADYITDAFARECVEFIRRNSTGEEPFFLYAPFTAPHVPILSHKRHKDRVTHIEDEKRREYAAVVVALDDAVGRILAELKEQKVWDNTLLFFISDNGAGSADGGSNAPFRGYKGNLLEGGIRVPYLVQWPEKLAAGRIFDHPVSTLDVAATSIAAASHAGATKEKGDRPGLDGVDLIPYLSGQRPEAPHSFLFYKLFAWTNAWAVRHSDWVLIGENTDEGQLYNLADDPSQTKNLARNYPELSDRLRAAWEGWNESTVLTPWSWKD